MGDNGRVLSIRVKDETLEKLDRLVARERQHARPGHTVARASIIVLAIEQYVDRRSRRTSRETSPA